MGTNPFAQARAPRDERTYAAARERWAQVAKPVGSLGYLEEAISRICALEGTLDISLAHKCMAVVCADNGVVAQGVSASTAEVTRIVARNVAEGTSSINRMCAVANVDVFAYDLGMIEPLDHPKMDNRRICAATADISSGPAMERAQALRAIETGIEIACELKGAGYEVIGTGEVGIGNTTTSTAVASLLLGKDPRDLSGAGAGLDEAGRSHKADIIERAIRVNAPDPSDPIDVLAKVGGLDLCCLAGICLGAAQAKIPVVLDGIISGAAALAAFRMDTTSVNAMIPSHLSEEPAASFILDSLGLVPVIHAGMRLGEGTGASAMMPLLDMALAVFQTAATFESSGIRLNDYDPKALT